MAKEPLTASEGAAIEVEGLVRRFGKTRALDGVSLDVQQGRVFGLVGENGAGKTTLIKHLLGLLKPQQGLVRVFGRDPVKDPEGVLGRLGYLSEDRDLPGWMRVGELMRYTQAFYPGWDPDYAQELLCTLDLDEDAKIRTLSRGQKAKAGLLAALAYRPPLLVLDEPSSGLDPVVRRDILGAIIRTVADEGRTVLFSSHLLEEVERVADEVAMIVRGKVALRGAVDDLKARHHRLTLVFDEAQPTAPALEGALHLTGEGREWTAICDGEADRLREGIKSLGGRIAEESPATLEDIFVARVAGTRAKEA